MKELIKKTGLLLMVLFAGFAVSSCSDDDDPPGVQGDLVGTWRVVSSYWAEYEDGALYYESNNSDVGQICVLNQNGSIEIDGYTVGTWGASGDAFYITYNEDGDVWTEQYNMTKESANRVTISYDVSYNENGSTWRYIQRLTLERQGGSGNDDGGDGNGGDDDGGDIVVNPEPPSGDIPETYPGAPAGVQVSVSDLVGQWRVTNGYSAWYVNGHLAESDPYTPDEGLGASWTLNADGTYTTSEGESGTWRIDGTTIYITMFEEGYGPETLPFTLAQFTGTEAELRIDYAENIDGMTYNSVESISFERI